MDATCTIQDSIHVFNLVHKYVSRILGTYHFRKEAGVVVFFAFFLCVVPGFGKCRMRRCDKIDTGRYQADIQSRIARIESVAVAV